MTDWSATINALIRESKTTIADLTRRTGMSKTTLDGFFYDGRPLSVAKLEKLLDALGYDLKPVKREEAR